MRRDGLVFVFAGLLILALVRLAPAAEISWEDISRGYLLEVKTVLAHPDNPKIIYAGAAAGVFKSQDSGLNWRNILLVRGSKRWVNFLLLGRADKNYLYAATSAGLYLSADSGARWKRIFQGKDYRENDCSAIAICPWGIYLGTKGGLFFSNDKGRSWHKQAGEPGNSKIIAISAPAKSDSLYIAAVGGVFKSIDRGQSWQKIFVFPETEISNEQEEPNDDSDEQEKASDLTAIACDPNNPSHIYLASSKGAWRSKDEGQSWEALSGYGLLSRCVKFLALSWQSRLYAATKSGIFEYKDNRWFELSLRLTAIKINFLSPDKDGNLYAACDEGLFRAGLKYLDKDRHGAVGVLYYKDEPKIKEVQEAAIRYAEVEPQKISRWRKQAAQKALLPTVSVGLDRNSGDLWHWESGSTTKSDDDILRRGRDNLDWDVTLSWDLGELIWNDDQTSIDVRSRLMVELRDDILDEVTKFYYERIRVKMELDELGIEERKKQLAKELRLEELTAYLDALTGGYFSSKIKSCIETGDEG